MTASLRDLGRRADAVPPPSFDVAGIVERGDARLRRRTALALGAVTLVTAVIAAGTALSGSGPRSSEPVEQPSRAARRARRARRSTSAAVASRSRSTVSVEGE